MTPAPDRVVFAPRATNELDNVIAYVATHSPEAAERLRGEILVALAALAAHEPRLDGPPVRLRSGLACHRWFTHPVSIFYLRSPGMLRVLRVHHYAREPITP